MSMGALPSAPRGPQPGQKAPPIGVTPACIEAGQQVRVPIFVECLRPDVACYSVAALWVLLNSVDRGSRRTTKKNLALQDARGDLRRVCCGDQLNPPWKADFVRIAEDRIGQLAGPLKPDRIERLSAYSCTFGGLVSGYTNQSRY